MGSRKVLRSVEVFYASCHTEKQISRYACSISVCWDQLACSHSLILSVFLFSVWLEALEKRVRQPLEELSESVRQG